MPKIYDPMGPQGFARRIVELNEIELVHTTAGQTSEANDARMEREELKSQFPTLLAEISRRAADPIYNKLGIATKYTAANSAYHAARLNEVSKNAPSPMRASYMDSISTDKIKELYLGEKPIPDGLRYDGFKNVQRGIASDEVEHAAEYGDSVAAKAQFLSLLKDQGDMALSGDVSKPIYSNDINVRVGHRNRSTVYAIGVKDSVFDDPANQMLEGIETTALNEDATGLHRTRAATVRDLMVQLRSGVIDPNLYNSFAKVYQSKVAAGDLAEVDRWKRMPMIKKLVAAATKNPEVVDFTITNEPTGLGPNDELEFAGRTVKERYGSELLGKLTGGALVGYREFEADSPLRKYIGVPATTGDTVVAAGAKIFAKPVLAATVMFEGARRLGYVSAAKLGKLLETDNYKKVIKDDLNYWALKSKQLRMEALQATKKPDVYEQKMALKALADANVNARRLDMRVKPISAAWARQLSKSNIVGDAPRNTPAVVNNPAAIQPPKADDGL